MTRRIDRRQFLTYSTTAVLSVAAGPLVAGRARAAGDRCVVAVGQWGIETPHAWRSSQSEKCLWDQLYDSLITRDPKTFAYRPGLASEWKPSNEMKTWTFKLRTGVPFHEGYGELTAEDVKFTVEQNLKPDAQGGSVPYFRNHLDRIEIPDKHTTVMHFRTRLWDVPSQFAQFVGYQNITSKKYVETVGEDKAAAHPIGTGPYRHVEGKQGDYHRFEAVPNHWRHTGSFKELVIRRIPDPATRMAGLRAGEIDVGQVFGDYLDQAAKAGLRRHSAPNAAAYWIILTGQTTPDREDYCPTCPWVGDAKDARSRDNARKVRLAMNLAVDKKAILQALWRGTGTDDPYSYYYYPFNKGFSRDWTVPPHDPERAKKLLAEAGHAGGFEIRVNPMVMVYALDGPDVMEAVSLDWERIGIKVKRVPEAVSSFLPKTRARKTAKTFSVYGSPPWDEPVIGWQRCFHSKGAFNLLLDGAYDEEIDTAYREFDTERRAKLQHDVGQKLYDGYHGVMLGWKSTTWALSKKVADWQTLAYTPMETNYEYLRAAS